MFMPCSIPSHEQSVFEYKKLPGPVCRSVVLIFRPSEITKTYPDESAGDGNTPTQKTTNGIAQNVLSGDVPDSPVHNPRTHSATESADKDVKLDLRTSELHPADATDSTALLNQAGDSNKKSKRRKKKSKKSNGISPLQDTKEEEVLPGTLKPSFRFLQKYLNFPPGAWVCGAVGIMWVIMLLFGIALMYGK